MNRDRLLRIARIAGYSAFFFLMYLSLTWLTFPWSKVRNQVVTRAADAGIAVQAEVLRGRLNGVSAKELTVGRLSEDGGGSPWVHLDKLRVKTPMLGAPRLGLELRSVLGEGGVALPEMLQRLSNATGRTRLVADLYGGELDADLAPGDEAARLNLAASGLDLSRYPLSIRGVDAAPTGTMKADADLTWHHEDPRKSSGSVDVEFASLVLAGVKVAGFAVPETAFDRSEAHLRIKSGKAEFRDTVFESEIVTAELSGFIALKKKVSRSTLSLNLKFKLRSDIDALAKVKLGSNPQHKDEEGWYHYQVLGSVKAPRFKESRRRGRGRARGGSKSAARAPKVGSSDDGDDDDDEPQPSRRRDRAESKDEVKRNSIDPERRAELEEKRRKLRDERAARREQQRDARRQRALDRAAEMGEELPIPDPMIDSDAFRIPPDQIPDGLDPDALDPGEPMEGDEPDGDYEDEPPSDEFQE